jgi:hypothetical protein
MRKRYIYTFLFLVPGLFFSLLVTFAVFAAAYGALWLYVFGDRTWPAWAGLWVVAMVAGYVVGRKLEAAPGFDARHVWLSLAATLLPIGIVLLQQLSIGNLGPKSDGQRCSEYCSALGYQASSTPPRHSGELTCSCLGQYGEVEITVPIAELPP